MYLFEYENQSTYKLPYKADENMFYNTGGGLYSATTEKQAVKDLIGVVLQRSSFMTSHRNAKTKIIETIRVKYIEQYPELFI